jgi:hypothetical protein
MTTVRHTGWIAFRWSALLPCLAIILFFFVPTKYLPSWMRSGPALLDMGQMYLIGYLALISGAVILVCKYAPEAPPVDTYSGTRNRAVMCCLVLAPAFMFAYAVPANLAGSGLLVRIAQAAGMIGSVIIVIRGYKVVSALVLVGLLLGGCMYIVNGRW